MLHQTKFQPLLLKWASAVQNNKTNSNTICLSSFVWSRWGSQFRRVTPSTTELMMIKIWRSTRSNHARSLGQPFIRIFMKFKVTSKSFRIYQWNIWVKIRINTFDVSLIYVRWKLWNFELSWFLWRFASQVLLFPVILIFFFTLLFFWSWIFNATFFPYKKQNSVVYFITWNNSSRSFLTDNLHWHSYLPFVFLSWHKHIFKLG